MSQIIALVSSYCETVSINSKENGERDGESAHLVVYTAELDVDFQSNVGEVLILFLLCECFRELHMYGLDAQFHIPDTLQWQISVSILGIKPYSNTLP